MKRKQSIEERGARVVSNGEGAVSIPVLASGRGWIAVDKPAGVSVHNEPGRDVCSLVLECIEKDAALRRKVELYPAFGVHPVHRLDKETSGVLLLAVNREAFRFFSGQFESRQVKKRYVAIVHGMLESAEGARGIWDRALGKSAGGREDPVGPGERQESVTRYRVLGHSAHYTLIEAEPLTGRTHQIRRHAKLAGHPVVGDARYGSMRAINFLRRNRGFGRLALHARALTLRCPEAKEPSVIATPAFPVQMQELFDKDLAPQAT